MKLILLVLTSALFVSTPSLAQITLDWQTTILCDTCKPRVAWYTDSKNGHIYTSTGYQRFPIQDYRTNDAGSSWRLASDSAYVYKESDVDNVQSYLDAGNIFWRDGNDLLFSQDSGIHWKRIHMFPVPTHVRMFTRDSGLAVRDDVELDKSHAIRLRASTDQGAYWYEEVGNPYAHPLGMRDAVILSDSELVILHSESFESEIMRTSDRGMTWTSVRKSTAEDSIVSWRLRSVDSSDILILESYFNEPVVLSLDRGKSWKAIPSI